MIYEKNKVIIAEAGSDADYPATPPFHPDEDFPEFSKQVPNSNEKNIIYGLVRQLLFDLGLDKRNYDSPEWNPLSEIIKPGDKVLIKPNLVRHIHLTGGDYRTVVTNSALIRCIMDYVALALKGEGKLTLGDAPVQSTDFDELVKKNSLKLICDDVERIWGIPVELIDFRLWSIQLNEKHSVIGEQTLSGDSQGYRAVNLGKDSFLQKIADSNQKYRITSYDSGDLQKHHNSQVNEYLIPKTILNADVVINLPKLKTHRKVALTAALKNLVGINGHKDWLPHHRIGSIKEGGDEYRSTSRLKQLSTLLIESIDKNRDSLLSKPRHLILRVLEKLIKYTAPDPYREGSWYGNDTLWRTVLDLNRLLIYADKEGIMQDSPQRRCLTIVDGVIGGESEGPMEPDPRNVGVLVGGFNPVAVDCTLASMIGFDYKKIPIIEKAFQQSRWPLVTFRPEDIKIITQSQLWSNLRIQEPCNALCFMPSRGWIGFVENEQCRKIIRKKEKRKMLSQENDSDNNWL
jgi:uncharacterized protein (DUF362 family)